MYITFIIFLPIGKCQQSAEQGKCQDYVVRWHYNGSLCTRFWYGGCDGNENNFETEDECRRECPGYFSEGKIPLKKTVPLFKLDQ